MVVFFSPYFWLFFLLPSSRGGGRLPSCHKKKKKKKKVLKEGGKYSFCYSAILENDERLGGDSNHVAVYYMISRIEKEGGVKGSTGQELFIHSLFFLASVAWRRKRADQNVFNPSQPLKQVINGARFLSFFFVKCFDCFAHRLPPLLLLLLLPLPPLLAKYIIKNVSAGTRNARKKNHFFGCGGVDGVPSLRGTPGCVFGGGCSTDFLEERARTVDEGSTCGGARGDHPSRRELQCTPRSPSPPALCYAKRSFVIIHWRFV